MRTGEWREWVQRIGRLSREDRLALRGELAARDSLDVALEVIEAPGTRCCLHCTGTQVVRNGHANGLQRYRCHDCRKTFNALTGTALARRHHRSKWLNQSVALTQGQSLRQVARQLGIALSTAHRWRHRFLRQPGVERIAALHGIAEVDETYFLHSYKGQKRLPRKARHRGGKACTRGLAPDLVPVLVARDRSGQTANLILPSTRAADMASALRPLLPTDTVLCTDGSSALAAAARSLGVEHHAINVSAGSRVRDAWHIQNVNAFDSRLKGWMARFKGIATRYLAHYLGWFRALDRSGCLASTPALFLTLAVQH
ncbi:IS1595 family transposase [Rhodocyclus tenuis]